MKRLQGYICGFLTAVVLLLAVPVLAASIDVVFNPLNIVINGVKATNKGENYTLANGDEVPFSIVYKGTTYLPLRKLAELTGKDIVLDSETDTVHLNDPIVIYNPKEEFIEKEGESVSEQQYVTRAELARFLVESLDLKDNGAKVEFADVPATHEYYNDINIVFQQGIMRYGTPPNFVPDDLISRWQYAAYLGRALKIDGTENAPEVNINDIDKIMIASHNTIKKLISIGAMELDEDGNFNPNDYQPSPLVPNPDLKNYIQK